MVFVTGGTGMLGAHLLLDLLRRGEKVRALKRAYSDIGFVKKLFGWYGDQMIPLFESIEWVEGDLCDKESLIRALEGIDIVIHAGAMVSFDPRDRQRIVEENTEGTANLVEAAMLQKVGRVCHVSSVAALGESDDQIPVSEDFSWSNSDKRSAYSESKFLSEMEVWRAIYEGLDAVIVNPSIILGPGKWQSGSPKLFLTVWNGLKFYTQGTNGFVDVNDVCKAIIGLTFSENWNLIKNNRYLISAENLSYRTVFNDIAVAFERPKATIPVNSFLLGITWRVLAFIRFITGSEPLITKETARSSMKKTLYDGSKIKTVIPFEYTPVKESIRRIAEIFLKEH